MNDLKSEVIEFINNYNDDGYIVLDNCHIPLIAAAAQCTGYVHFDVFSKLVKFIEDDVDTHGFFVEQQPDKTVAFWTEEHMLVTRFHTGESIDTIAGVLIPWGDVPAPTVEEAAETLINFCNKVIEYYPSMVQLALEAYSNYNGAIPKQ